MIVIGVVLRLQVQRSRLKPGAALTRRYDPAPLREVEALEVGPRGVTGCSGAERILDVHHADHPDTRNVRLGNGLSLLPQRHYQSLRAAYGPHLVDGSAGESVLLQTTGSWGPDALGGRLWLDTDDGLLELTGARPAPPCVEFSRFVLRREPGDTGAQVLAALADLDHGARGFYVTAAGTGVLRVGARLWRDDGRHLPAQPPAQPSAQPPAQPPAQR